MKTQQPNKNGRIYPSILLNRINDRLSQKIYNAEQYNEMSEEKKMSLVNKENHYIKTGGATDVTYMKINDYMYHYDRLFFNKYKLLFDDYNTEFKQYVRI